MGRCVAGVNAPERALPSGLRELHMLEYTQAMLDLVNVIRGRVDQQSRALSVFDCRCSIARNSTTHGEGNTASSVPLFVGQMGGWGPRGAREQWPESTSTEYE